MGQRISGIYYLEPLAERLVDPRFAYKGKAPAIRQRFLPTLRALLPPLEAARFYRLENRFDAGIEAELALLIPSIELVLEAA